MTKPQSNLSKFLNWSAKTAGHPYTFICALGFIGLWVIGGIFWQFNDTWLLVLNTIATVNATLMVFIIQNTQNKESRALHLKIDELIRVTKEAENELIAIEEKEEIELELIRQKIFQKHNQYPNEENK